MIADDSSQLADVGAQASLTRLGAVFDQDITVWNRPAGGAQAGGDWCDAVAISDDTLAVAVGDVSGHGDAVAGRMATMRAAVLRNVHDHRAPSAVLARANDAAFHPDDGTLVTAIIAFFNHRERTLTFANAGHPPPLLVTRDGEAFLEHPPADVPLGVFKRFCPADYAIAVPRDAMLVFYTDGITEHDRDPIRGELELRRAARRALERPKVDAARTIARLLLRRRPGTDDATVLVLRTGQGETAEH